ncbi:MAG TPA: hypothetical protein VIT92_14890 [Burkholderiaceae bacterium]
MATVFEYMAAPPYFVVRDADGYWLVPGAENGWQQREPFVGHVTNLRPLADALPYALGLPPE